VLNVLAAYSGIKCRIELWFRGPSRVRAGLPPSFRATGQITLLRSKSCFLQIQL
jgi:hypothetical protein